MHAQSPRLMQEMMKFSGLVRASENLRARFQQFVFKNVFPQLQIAYPGFHLDATQDAGRTSVFDDFLLFAAPKSKVIEFI